VPAFSLSDLNLLNRWSSKVWRPILIALELRHLEDGDPRRMIVVPAFYFSDLNLLNRWLSKVWRPILIVPELSHLEYGDSGQRTE
jgi:hypothetical protein